MTQDTEAAKPAPIMVLITKDGSSKVPREVASLEEARQIAATGFHVELLHDEGRTSPLPEAEAVTEDAPPAKKAVPAKKAAPVKTAAKTTKKR